MDKHPEDGGAARSTKGPWRVHRDERGRGYEIVSSGGGGRRAREICRINSRRQGAGRGVAVRYFEHPDDAANADLLAAAPDLAHALQNLLSALRPEEASYEKCRDAPGIAETALRKA